MKPRNIFHDTSLKLTAMYLTIIMVISLLFSIGLYRVSAEEIERGIRLEGPVSQVLRTRNAELIKDLKEEQNKAITEAQGRIQNSLILINLIILFGGGLISYMFAKRTLEPIEKAHESQRRFTADASHELRTPITAMRAETELTLTDEKLNLKKAKDQLTSNIEELDKLTDLSDGLLQLARFNENGIETTELSLKHIIDQATENISSKINRKKQKISVELKKDIKVRGSKATITQLLTILLDNASKYSPNTSTITVTLTARKHWAVVAISDTGVGIRAGELPHIFDRFYRADSSRTKSSSQGYGIGLSIAKSIVELHDGKITAASTPDKGSTFTISLPR